MSGKLRRWYVPLGAAAFLLTSATPALAGGVLDPTPVTPNQAFTGLVNGQREQAAIAVVCDRPGSRHSSPWPIYSFTPPGALPGFGGSRASLSPTRPRVTPPFDSSRPSFQSRIESSH